MTWKYPDDRAIRIRRCRDGLAVLLHDVQQKVPKDSPPGNATLTAIGFWRSVVVGVARAEAADAEQEWVMVQSLFDHGAEVRERDRWTLKQPVMQEEIEALRAYVAAARRLEQSRSTDHLSRLRAIVTELLSLSSRDDVRSSRREAAFGRTVLETIGIVKVGS